MSTKRRETSKIIRDERGAIVCSCGCGRKPPVGRRTWFSDACVDSWKDRNDPGHMRQKVLARDSGVCALCGADTVEIMRRYRAAYHEISRYVGWWINSVRGEVLRSMPRERQTWHGAAMEAARIYRKDAWMAELLAPYASREWQADHIVPVCLGGGQCGIDNYRTLCTPCHKQVTKEPAGHRAKARKSQQPELQMQG